MKTVQFMVFKKIQSHAKSSNTGFLKGLFRVHLSVGRGNVLPAGSENTMNHSNY